METCSSVAFDSLASRHGTKRGCGQGRPTCSKQAHDKKRKVVIRSSPVFVDKIIDMRGPCVNVITDFNTLNKKRKTGQQQQQVLINKKRKKHVPVVVEKVIDVKEPELFNVLDHEEIKDEAKRKKRKIEDDDIVNVLDLMLTLEILAETYMDLQIRYCKDYDSLKLSTLACSYALPLFTKLFQGCDLLESPSHGVDIVRIWKRLLLGKYSIYDSDMYTQLLMKVLCPVLGVSIAESWNVKDPKPMLRFLVCWKELLPRCVLDDIVDDFIVPKLLGAVDSWDSLTDNVPIHCWIHPWLPLLGRKLESYYGTIYLGFARAIRAWKVTDTSAYDMLSPWKTVFDSVSWGKLMWRHVVPKLTSVMKGMEINHAKQATDQFRCVQMWASVVHIDYMLLIMDIFFDKWQQVLFQWLCRKPNYEEVGKWFLGWKESLHVEIQAHEHIRYRLSIGLRMMNQAAEGLEVDPPFAYEDIDFSGTRSGSKDKRGGSEMSLKEVIQVHAEMNDLELKPKYARTKDGLQVYGFGSVSILMDSANQTVFAWSEDRWSLVTLQKLLELQHRTG